MSAGAEPGGGEVPPRRWDLVKTGGGVDAPSRPAVRPTTRSAAIDGLRGFALSGMLMWHAQVGWVRGGFARMTIFFVLAGFLSTKTVRRLASTPGVGRWRSFGSFWARRARRLLPLTILGVGLAVWVTWRYAGSTSRGRLLGDTISVLTSWSNWRFVAEKRSYGAFFESPSAFQHFWSLSAEEQCFLLLPVMILVAVILAARVGRFTPHEPLRTAAVLAAMGAFGCAIPLLVPQSPDTVYYGTHARLGEVLVGAALAVAWEHVGPALTPRSAARWATAGTFGLAGLVAVMLLIDRNGTWIYRGGMGLVVIPTVAVLGGILAGGKAVNSILGIAPLRWMGRGALSIYALHWPIYQIVEAHMAGTTRWLVVFVELAVALCVGAVVFVLVERPLLPGSGGTAARVWAKGRVAFPTVCLAATSCLLAAVAVPPLKAPIPFDELAVNPEATASMSVADAEAVLAADGTARPALPVIRDRSRIGVALFGGSTALTLALGYDTWATTVPWAQMVPGYAPLGCGLLDDGERAHDDPGNELPEGPVPPECRSRAIRWAATTTAYAIQVPVIVASTAELTTWRLPGEDTWRALGDPIVDRRVLDALLASVDGLIAAGAQHVVLTTAVSPSPEMDPDAAELRRRRIARYGELLRQVAEQRDVTIVDLTSWSDSLSRAERRELLPDGIHVSTTGGRRVWTEVLGPALSALHEAGGLSAPGG